METNVVILDLEEKKSTLYIQLEITHKEVVQVVDIEVDRKKININFNTEYEDELLKDLRKIVFDYVNNFNNIPNAEYIENELEKKNFDNKIKIRKN